MDNKLYIPYGIKIKKDVIDGFGKKEFKQFIIGICISVAAAVIAYIISGTPFMAIPALILGVFASYISTRRQHYQQSIVGVISCILRFYKSQQIFKYKYRWRK